MVSTRPDPKWLLESSHHIMIPTSRKSKKVKKFVPPTFKDTFWKL